MPAVAAVVPPEGPADSMAVAKAAFLEQWKEEYGYGGRIDQLYRDEVGCRMKPHEHYLDYTGSSLYCSSALQCVFEDLQVTTDLPLPDRLYAAFSVMSSTIKLKQLSTGPVCPALGSIMHLL